MRLLRRAKALLAMTCLIRILKILRDQIGDIRRCMLTEDAEEIGGGGDLSFFLREIILNECKENFIAHACAQVL